MSKQEHDKDEQRAPSGAGKDDAPTDASQASATDNESPSKDKDTASPPVSRKAADSDKSAAPTAKPGSGDKSSSGESAASKSASNRGGSGKSDANKNDSNNSGSDKNVSSKPSQQGSGESRIDGTVTRNGGGSGGKAGGIALVLVVLLALVVLIGGWWGWQKLSAQQQRLTQIESNANAIAEIESQLGERDRQREQALQGMRDEMQQYRDSVDQTLDRVLEDLASEQQADPSDWLYAEVEYLLRLANQRLQLERDVQGAQSLLRTADERLARADNPALTPVRRAIQSELGALGSVSEVDRTGLYLTLMAQQEQLAQLPLEQDVEQIAAEGGDTSPVEGAWREQLARFGQELKDLVVVRRHDQALEALLTPEQEVYLRQNVRLQLEQAQLALLQVNPELYQASLEKATTLIEGYYDTGSPGVGESLEQLRTLADRTIRPELPDISGSLQELRDFMERRRDAGGDDA